MSNTEDNENKSQPWYEVEDNGCKCTEGECPVDSEWEWNVEQGCYVCSGCGDVQ